MLRNVKITPKPAARVLVGDTLILNCTGETTWNGKINFTWDFPKRSVSSGFNTVYVNSVLQCVIVQECDLWYLLCLQAKRHFWNNTRGHGANVIVISKALVLPNISMEDKGTYHCKAETEPTTHINATVKVIVYGKYALNGYKIR